MKPDEPLIVALLSIQFDIDKGQLVEECCPPGALSEAEQRDVAFHAFPDNLSLELSMASSSVRDSTFLFNLRRSPDRRSPEDGPLLFGAAFCRQRQDERLPRGAEQRSLAVLGRAPLGGVLLPLAHYAGPLLFTYGVGALRAVFEEVAAWPEPRWGGPALLPLGPASVAAELPELFVLPAPLAPEGRGRPAGAATAGGAGSSGHPGRALAGELDGDTGLPLCLLPRAAGQQEVTPSAYSEADAYTPLRAVLPHLWTLWEVLVLSEPLMVVSPSPGVCSGTVAALVSLLAPLPYSSDCRPYFTIHDAEFARAAGADGSADGSGSGDGDGSRGLPPLLGVTNVYMVKALPDWPNVLATGYTPATQPLSPRMSEQQPAAGAGGGNGRGRGGPGGFGSMLRRAPQGPEVLLSTPADGLWLSYKPLSRPDAAVLRSLVPPPDGPGGGGERWARAAHVNGALLRRHFQELGRALLFPLLPYISPSLPPGAGATPRELRQPPPLPELEPASLLAGLASRSAAVPDILLQRFGGHKPLAKFYARFLDSPNLRAWLARQRVAAAEWQARVWRAAWRDAGGPCAGLEHRDEVVAVQRLASLEERLAAARASGEQEAGSAAALAAELAAALEALPADLRGAVLAAPRRAELLTPGAAGAGV